MGFEISRWRRFDFDGTPIYVRPDKPDWFVPNRSGDLVLRQVRDGAWSGDQIRASRFLLRLPDEPPKEYRGRVEVLTTDRLNEVWLHVTNRCNGPSASSHGSFKGPSTSDPRRRNQHRPERRTRGRGRFAARPSPSPSRRSRLVLFDGPSKPIVAWRKHSPTCDRSARKH